MQGPAFLLPLQFVLTGAAPERRRFVEAFEEFAHAHHLPIPVRQAADLAIEEHLTNILSYGYEPGVKPQVVIHLETDAEWLRVKVEDNGKPYDPLATPPVDTSIPLEEKPIGGLGVHLMRQFMDELSYAREAGKNVLKMGKRLGTEPLDA